MYSLIIAVTCVGVSLSNGAVNYNSSHVSVARYPVNTVATFSCNRGYSRSGAGSRTCQTSGEWNQHTPTCNQGNE